MSGYFPSGVNADELQLSDEYWNLVDKIDSSINHINDNGGFTVIGWYKRGIINDKSIVTGTNHTGSNQGGNNSNTNPDIQVDNGEINYHPCIIRPTDKRFARDSSIARQLEARKYNVTEYVNGTNDNNVQQAN